MSKGRNAAKAFNATRAARFAESRREADQARDKRRSLLLLPVADVQPTDEVTLASGGFALAGDTPRDKWLVSNGETFVRRR